MAGRKGEYLFKRAGSANWQIRFVYPPRPGETKPVQGQFSLGTPDRLEAEIAAAEHIKAHKLVLHSYKAIRSGAAKSVIRHRFTPGREHHLEDGTRVIATADQLIFLDRAGGMRVEPNTVSEMIRITATPAQAAALGVINPKPARKVDSSADIAHLERWIAHKKIGGYLEKEARAAWVLFRELTDNKPLAECDRDDGRKLVAHLFDLGNKSATVQKKVGHLCAAVNLAIGEKKLRFNPFSSIIPKTNDATLRLPLDDDDMTRIREGRDTFAQAEWLLFMLCATTGMRRSEAYEIEGETIEKGVRFVIVGEKTEQSKRRVPLPAAVLPLLPNKITGKLFAPDLTAEAARKNDVKNLGREVLRQMRRLGITNPQKTLHSTRHRAKDRLRAEGCPLDIQHHLLGHEEKTIAQGYGNGYPIGVLKEWVERIGY